MRVHRLITILMMIDKAHKIKAAQLAKTLEVSTRTIYRDIDVLSEAGFPLFATTGPEGGISFMDGYSLGVTNNGEGDMDVLTSLMNQVLLIPDKVSTARSVETGFAQLQDLLKEQSTISSTLSNKILIDQETWWGEAHDPFDIRILIDALWSQKSLTIDYEKLDGSLTHRNVNPYGLILKHTNWYMVAYCSSAKGLRTFRCERILKSILKTDSYEIPMSFSLKTHWTKAVKQFTNATTTKSNDYLVTLEIPPAFTAIYSEKGIAWNGRNGSNYMGVLNLKNETLAKEEIITSIGYAKVIKPPEMVDYAKQVLEDQLNNYVKIQRSHQ